MLEFFDLAHKRDELAGNLAFGEQRRLEFARAFAAKPALLLLDEPAAGMNAEEIDQLDARIRKLRDTGMAILLIEHHVELVMVDRGPDRRAQFRPEDRRRRAGRQCRTIRWCARPISAPRRRREEQTMLDVADLVTAYGKIEALKGVSLQVESGRITCLLGPNGAGKTTLMMSIAAILKPRRGSIRLDGDELVGLSPAKIVAKGVALVPENRLVFPQMSVRENLYAGAYQRTRQGRCRSRHRAHVCALPAAQGTAGADWRERSRVASSRCWRSLAR